MLTGKVTAWIEVGAPAAERVHRGSKLAGRAAVYTHRDPQSLLAQLANARIHRAESIPVYAVERSFLSDLAQRLQRRSRIALSITERQLYADVDGHSLVTAISEHRIV